MLIFINNCGKIINIRELFINLIDKSMKDFENIEQPEQHNSKIELSFFRHSEKEADASKSEFDLDLTPAGEKQALEKSDVGNFEQALNHDCEIICVDSRQVFKDIDIASAKITEQEMQGVPHHGIDLITPDTK